MKPGDKIYRGPCRLICYGVPHSLVCSATYEVERISMRAVPGSLHQRYWGVCDMVYRSLTWCTEVRILFRLLDSDHGHRLLLDFVERMALELDLLEVDVHQVDAADVAVPRRAVV